MRIAIAPLLASLLVLLSACSDTPPGSTDDIADTGADITEGDTDDDAGDDVATIDTADDADEPDAEPDIEPDTDDEDSGPCDTLGCPCVDDVDCASGYCLDGPDGTRVCSELCSEGCSEPGYECRVLVNATGDAVRLCVPTGSSYCAECENSIDCGDLRASCQELDDGSRACLPACGDESLCPAGSTCTDVGGGSQLCVPDIGICRGCVDLDNDRHGVGPDCMGADPDDSDDTIYEGAPELCDEKDNDGDGEVDEGFDLQTSPIHCGSCGTVCEFANANAVCDAGVCAIESCVEGYADCNLSEGDGCEVDTTSNPFNCGGCGEEFSCEVPNADTECVDSACVILECDGSFGDCDADVANGCETNLLTDLDHCGECDALCAFDDAAAQCSGGVCGLGDCDEGFADCNMSADDGCETATFDNDAACGGCGLVCDPPNGAGECDGTECVILGCFGDYLSCDGDPFNGCETDSDVSLEHCGACGNACTAENGTATCDRGACAIDACNDNYDDCDGEIDNGCETYLIDNIIACGSCDNRCEPVPNATVECDGTSCAIASCEPGFADCNRNYADGCEADLTDPATCLSCDNACAYDNGVAGCDVGGCFLFECEEGFFNANGTLADGCEYRCERTNGGVEICDTIDNDCDNLIDEDFAFNTDEENCGVCGNVCAAEQATGTCVAGTCEFSCTSPWGNCDGDFVTNGCEVNLDADADNCNTCGNACSLPGGTNVCVEGACAVSECTAPFADCTAAAGCETNTDTSLLHCGGCGQPCSTTNVAAGRCENGTCIIERCETGFGDCDGNPANGCEVNLGNDPTHCGACNNTCRNPNGATTCSDGVCAPSCNTGFGNCDGNLENGCELQLNTSSNCATCGGSCSLANADESCATGQCLVTDCDNKWCDLNGAPADGCEFDLDTNPACGTFESIGAVNGDSGTTTITRNGIGEQRFQVRVNEGNSDPLSCNDLGLTIRLVSPPGSDYDLEAWCDGCSGDGRVSALGLGEADEVVLRWDEDCTFIGVPAGTDSGRTINIQVRHFGGNSCAPFTLQVTGNRFSGDNTCSAR